MIWCLFNLLASVSSRGVSRTPAGTKIDFFETTSNDYQSLTVITKSCILDATDIQDLTLSRIQYKDVKSVGASAPIRLWILCFNCAKYHNNVRTALCRNLI